MTRPGSDPQEDLLSRPAEKAHMVHLCRDAASLRTMVSRYLSDGFRCGEAAAVIATRSHVGEFRRELRDRGVDAERLEDEGRLAVLDARSTLDRFMRHGMPDETLFRQTVGAVLSELSAKSPPNIRAYGEMVSVLWSEGRFDAAVRLEELWNRLGENLNFTLLCVYEGDLLAPEFHGRSAEAMYRQHSHFVSVQDYERLSHAVRLAMEEVLGKAEAGALWPLIAATKRRVAPLPGAQAALLWLQSNLPDRVPAVLTAARRLAADRREP